MWILVGFLIRFCLFPEGGGLDDLHVKGRSWLLHVGIFQVRRVCLVLSGSRDRVGNGDLGNVFDVCLLLAP